MPGGGPGKPGGPGRPGGPGKSGVPGAPEDPGKPAPEGAEKPELPEGEWKRADAVFTRDSSGGGRWSFSRPLPESWITEWGSFRLKVKPTGFGHLGFFAEQFRNWEFFRSAASGLGKGAKALNLFGYSGVGSMAMAQSGAGVCHLDASRGMIEWGRENLALNAAVPDAIRWIADDVTKFTAREVRRDSKYNLIALDPPTFGRGSSGQLWKIEEDLPKLLARCAELRDRSRPFTLVLSCHSRASRCWCSSGWCRRPSGGAASLSPAR